MDMVLAVVLGLFFVVMLIAGIRFSFKRSSTWVVKAEGQFNRATFGQRISLGYRSGAFAGAHSLEPIADIYFYDGTLCVARGVGQVPFERGTRIRVLENGLGDCKVENVEERR